MYWLLLRRKRKLRKIKDMLMIPKNMGIWGKKDLIDLD